jgi:serine/threonine protein kinase
MKELVLQNCRLDGRYDVQSLLGRGSYAEIYVARDILASPQSPHGFVVIKALNVFLQNDLDADLERTLVENFQNEAIALDRVRHPNIISRLGHGTAKDLKGTVFHYLVLEYLPGGDLAKAYGRQGLPLDLALEFLEQVCAGLSFAHSKGVIHRDIKPQNLLLTKDRQTVKIADFGVARVSQGDEPITRVGTNVYAPPEHSPHFIGTEEVMTVTKLTPAADIYSLAKSTYVLLTGESPRKFSNAAITDLPETIRQKPWANELLRVLRKATQSNPSDRYQTVNDFWKGLGAVAAFDVAEEPETETEVASRPHPLPQPSISEGFSPIAPLIPKFNTSRELKFKNGNLQENNPRLVVNLEEDKKIQPSPQPRLPEPVKTKTIDDPPKIETKKRKPLNKTLKRAVFLAVFLLMFAGALFVTQNYMRNKQLFPTVSNPFKKPEGVAKNDVNLRTDADANSQKIGLVPKGSRVRIVNSKDNWYEIDVTEFARPKDNQTDAEHGWVNGTYIDINN